MINDMAIVMLFFFALIFSIFSIVFFLFVQYRQSRDRWLSRNGYGLEWKVYAFEDPYSYERNGAFWTCQGCNKHARTRLADGKIAARCEHCGYLWYGADHHYEIRQSAGEFLDRVAHPWEKRRNERP